MDIKFLEAIHSLPKSLQSMLVNLPEELQKKVREICIRSDKPLIVMTFDGEYFVSKNGMFSKNVTTSPYIVSKEEIAECVKILTEYSLHSYKQEINTGFITIKGGHRAGIAGSCVYEKDKILTVNDISSINLRIARQIKGIAYDLCKLLYNSEVQSTLIAGSPASGKTTLLKDISACLSNGSLGYYTKISIIDERGEIAAVYKGIPQNEVGMMTDVFDGYKKGEGMSIAIRSMSPKVIIIDEIAGENDANQIRQSLNAGVAVIATVHASTLDEIYRKKHIKELIAESAFSQIVLLDGPDNPCKIKEILTPKELTEC